MKQGITPGVQSGTAGSSPASRSKPSLQLISRQEALSFYRQWHYSGTAPSGTHLGYYDDKGLAGALTLKSVSARLGTYYQFDNLITKELSRLALRDDCPKNSESRMLAALFGWSRKNGIHLLLSYADPGEGHAGIIYRATNWLYLGQWMNFTGNRHRGLSKRMFIDGVEISRRALYNRHGTQAIPALTAIYGARLTTKRRFYKHIYLMPLSRKVRTLVEQRFSDWLTSWK